MPGCLVEWFRRDIGEVTSVFLDEVLNQLRGDLREIEALCRDDEPAPNVVIGLRALYATFADTLVRRIGGDHVTLHQLTRAAV